MIASHGSGRPEHRMTSLELNLSAVAVAAFPTNFIASSLLYVAYRQAPADAWALARARVGVTLFGLLLVVALFRFHSLFAVGWVRIERSGQFWLFPPTSVTCCFGAMRTPVRFQPGAPPNILVRVERATRKLSKNG